MLGDRIKKIRKLRNLTQRELSRLSGVSQQMICKLENNQITNSGLILPISDALNVDYRFIVDSNAPVTDEALKASKSSFGIYEINQAIASSFNDCVTVIGNKFKETGKQFLMDDSATQELFLEVLQASVQSRLGKSFITDMVDNQYNSKFG